MSGNKENIDSKKIRKSNSYIKAKIKAEEYVNDNIKILELIKNASEKAEKNNSSLKNVWDYIQIIFRLLKSYSKHTYKSMPIKSIILIIASIIYLLMPIDMIPDFILAIGFIDDVALFS